MENILIYPLCTHMAGSKSGHSGANRPGDSGVLWHLYLYACLGGAKTQIAVTYPFHAFDCPNCQVDMAFRLKLELAPICKWICSKKYIYTGSTYRSSTYMYIYEFLHEFYIVRVYVCAFWGHKMLWWLHKILKNLISKFSCLPRPLQQQQQSVSPPA